MENPAMQRHALFSLLTITKAGIFTASLLPFARLIWLGFHDALSANPVEFITHQTGIWALNFLCLTLAISPLRWLTKLTVWLRFRRMLGLFCFFYASLHAAIWLWLEHALSFKSMAADFFQRPFIVAGVFAFVLLIPLALTSTTAMMKYLGKNWIRLHRLVYVIAIAAVTHYWWDKAGKNDFATVSAYVWVLSGLLGIRCWWLIEKKILTTRGKIERVQQVPK